MAPLSATHLTRTPPMSTESPLTDSPETLLERLAAADILRKKPDGLTLSNRFRTERATVTGSVDASSALRAQIRDQTAEDASSVEPKLPATAVTLRRILPSLTPSEAVAAARTLRRIEVSQRIDGVPSGFLSLCADELPGFLTSNSAALVFCWRENSQPSKQLRRELEQLHQEGAIPPAFGLGAVYGPSNVRTLQDRYDVAVAPTLLFCVDGRVDCRLVGHHDPTTIQNEIRILTEMADL